MSVLVTVAAPRTPTVEATADLAEERGWDVIRIDLDRLANASLTVTMSTASVGGRPIDATFVDLSPLHEVAEDFVADDRAFCGIETKAAWLAVTNLQNVVSVNRLDADFLFGRSEWGTWRARFAADGLPLAPLRLGPRQTRSEDRWLPWGGGVLGAKDAAVSRVFGAAICRGPITDHDVCFGRVIDEAAPPVVARAACLMADSGCNLGLVRLAGDGRLVGAWSTSTSLDAAISDLAERIVEGLDAAARR